MKREGIVTFLPERDVFVVVVSFVAESFESFFVIVSFGGRSAVVFDMSSLAVNAGFRRSMFMLLRRPRIMMV